MIRINNYKIFKEIIMKLRSTALKKNKLLITKRVNNLSNRDKERRE